MPPFYTFGPRNHATAMARWCPKCAAIEAYPSPWLTVRSFGRPGEAGTKAGWAAVWCLLASNCNPIAACMAHAPGTSAGTQMTQESGYATSHRVRSTKQRTWPSQGVDIEAISAGSDIYQDLVRAECVLRITLRHWAKFLL
jgi:hypothetical protein